MGKTFTVVVERTEDGSYIGHIPELRDCLTQAETREELMLQLREAAILSLQVDGQGENFVTFVDTQGDDIL